MAVSYVAAGAVVSGTTSLTPAFPAGIASGDLLLLVVVNKYPTNGPSTPSGWTLVAQKSGGAGSAGVDSGNVYTTVYYKVASGSESGTETVTVTSANVSLAQILCYTNATGAWSLASTTDDDVAGSTLSFTFPADPGVTAGDMIVAVTGINGTGATYSSVTFTQTGVTFGTITLQTAGSTPTGDNAQLVVYRTPVLSGTSSAAPSHSFIASTWFGNYPAGACVFVRLRETSAGPTIYTLNADAIALSLTGAVADTLFDRTLDSAAFAATLTASAADTLRVYTLNADGVTISLTAASADTFKDFALGADAVSVQVTPLAADLQVVTAGTVYTLNADAAAIDLTGVSAGLEYIPLNPPVPAPSTGSGGGWTDHKRRRKKELNKLLETAIDKQLEPEIPVAVLPTPAQPAYFPSKVEVDKIVDAMLPRKAPIKVVRKAVPKKKPQPVVEDDYDDEELAVIALLAG